jgi:hypothetical protein
MGCCPRPKVAVALGDSALAITAVTECGDLQSLARIIVSWRRGPVFCAIGGVVKQAGMTLGVRFG